MEDPPAAAAPSSTPEKPERAMTDESLRAERSDADQALAEKRSAEESADRIIERARARADAVLDHARDKADDKIEAAGCAVRSLHDVMEKEREQEDTVLQAERAAADERLRREREEQARVLESLLVKERANTDRYLLTERDRSDDAIANRDDFLGMVSHDLRNHLNSISLDAQLLMVKAGDTEEGRRCTEGMKRVQRHVVRMGRIVNDLIDVVSIDAGRLSIRPAPADAASLLAEAAAAVAAPAADKNIELKVEHGTEALTGSYDHHRMLQVLGNCLSNAVKFTPAGGKVVLRGERIGQELHFTVTDTGPGIPAHLHEAVFQRFWQVGKNDKRGLGLGLYISRCIIEGHHGSIRVQSSSAKGTTFCCVLPRQAPPAGSGEQGGDGPRHDAASGQARAARPGS